MSRTHCPRNQDPLASLSIAIGCVAALVAVAPAHAGLGDIVKKAKEKAAKAVAPKTEAATPADDGKPVFDDVTLELTNARVEKILAAFKAAASAGAGRPALAEKLAKTQAGREALWDKHGEAIMEIRRKRGDIEVCHHDGYQEAQDRRSQEYRERALTDPAIREKFAKAAAEHNAAAARGDTTAIQKLQQVLAEEVRPTKEDSVKVRQKCGPLPPPLPSEGKVDALDQQIASLQSEIRAIDEKVAEAQSKDVGLTRQQFAVALERIQMYLAWFDSQAKSKSNTSATPRGFTPEEIEALEKHRDELRAALG